MAWTDQFKIIELVEYRKTTTLDSGIDVAPWITVALPLKKFHIIF